MLKQLFLISVILTTIYGCTKKEPKIDNKITIVETNENNRFTHYRLISDTLETIEAQYSESMFMDRPNFITTENYIKHKEKEDFVEYCFFLDYKDTNPVIFSEDIKKDLQNGKAVRFFGKFYITKQFDEIFPNKVFENQRKSGNLSFEPKDGNFKVFVIEKYEKIN